MILAKLKPLAQILDESGTTSRYPRRGPGAEKNVNHPHSGLHSLLIPMSEHYYNRAVFIKRKNDYTKNKPPRSIYEVYHNKTDNVQHFLAYDCWFSWIENIKVDDYLPKELFEI